MYQNKNNSIKINRDPKQIPKLSEKSAVDSYLNVNNNSNVNKQNISQSKGSYKSLNNPNAELLKAASELKSSSLEQPSENIEKLKSSAFLGKHLGMETRPVEPEKSIDIKNENSPISNHSDFSKVGFAFNNQSNEVKVPFGAEMMAEQGIQKEDIVIERLKDEQYIDPNALKIEQERQKEKLKRKRWQKIIAALIIILVIILIIFLYNMLGPSSNKHKLSCINNNYDEIIGATVSESKIYYYEKRGLYKLVSTKKYVFNSSDQFDSYHNSYTDQGIYNIKGLLYENYFNDDDKTFTIKETYDYNKLKENTLNTSTSEDFIQITSEGVSVINLQITDINTLKQSEEDQGLKCSIK